MHLRIFTFYTVTMNRTFYNCCHCFVALSNADICKRIWTWFYRHWSFSKNVVLLCWLLCCTFQQIAWAWNIWDAHSDERCCIFTRNTSDQSVIGLKRVLGYSDSGRCQTSTRYYPSTRVLGIYNDGRKLCCKVACGHYFKAYLTSVVITVTMLYVLTVLRA